MTLVIFSPDDSRHRSRRLWSVILTICRTNTSTCTGTSYRCIWVHPTGGAVSCRGRLPGVPPYEYQSIRYSDITRTRINRGFTVQVRFCIRVYSTPPVDKCQMDISNPYGMSSATRTVPEAPRNFQFSLSTKLQRKMYILLYVTCLNFTK